MTIASLMGPTLITHVLFYAALVVVVADLLSTLFTLFYQEVWYKRFYRPRLPVYHPRCSIIVPCKGIPKDFGKNLEGFLELDYPSCEVIYVVENEKDPATPVIRSLVERHPEARLVVAGLSTTCGQKNHNMLAGVATVKDPEILVFADSDIKPAKQWLTELVAPLSNPKVSVTSGFRWLHPPRGTVGEQTHQYANVFIYVTFCTASFLGGVGLWGGSMAIRRENFDSFGVAEKWSKSAVDDMSLSQLVVKHRGKGVVVPTCITHSDDLLATVGSATTWFIRQTMFLKSHFKPLWLFGGFPPSATGLIMGVLLPVAALLSLSPRWSFFGLGGGAALVFFIGGLLPSLLYPLLGPMRHIHTFLFFQPFMRLTQVFAYFMTMTTNIITWAGTRYHLNFAGHVVRVERPKPTPSTR